MAGETAEDVSKQGIAVNVMAENLTNGHGIRGVALKMGLVDIDAYSRSGDADGGTAEDMIEKHTADLTVVPIDVVRPFHPAFTHQRRERFGHRQGQGFGKEELAIGGHALRTEGEAEEKVLARGGFPMGVDLSVACRLMVGGDEQESLGGDFIGGKVLHAGHGGVSGGEMDMLPVRKLRKGGRHILFAFCGEVCEALPRGNGR